MNGDANSLPDFENFNLSDDDLFRDIVPQKKAKQSCITKKQSCMTKNLQYNIEISAADKILQKLSEMQQVDSDALEVISNFPEEPPQDDLVEFYINLSVDDSVISNMNIAGDLSQVESLIEIVNEIQQSIDLENIDMPEQPLVGQKRPLIIQNYIKDTIEPNKKRRLIT